MRHIEIYPLNFAPVAYLRALCCFTPDLNPRFGLALIGAIARREIAIYQRYSLLFSGLKCCIFVSNKGR